MCAAPPSVRRTKIHDDKGYHTALITIKQGDQHSGPNRNPKHNQTETKVYYSFRHVDVLTRIAKIHVVTIYSIYEQIHLLYIRVKHVTLFNHRAKNKGRLLEVVRRKPGYNVYYFSVGANCSVRCRGLI